jgi:AraC-like DNA-binding protein
LVGYLSANASTLGDVLGVAAKYLRLLTEGTRVDIVVTGEWVRVEQRLLDPSGAGSRQVALLGASSLVRVTRLLTGTMLAPAWVEFAFDSCDDEAEYRRVLGAPTRPGQPCTAVVLEQRQLTVRAIGADPDLFDLLEQVCRERVSALPEPRDLRARTENVILELLPYSTPSLDRVARRLGTSSRSLSRGLAKEGTSFKVLVDELRRELARRYLEQGVHRPKSIAALLGYKDLSAFHHAFRRWTGTTPARFSQDPRTSCKPS